MQTDASNKVKVLFDEQNIEELDQVAQMKRKQKDMLQREEDEDPKTPYNEVSENEQAQLDLQDLAEMKQNAQDGVMNSTDEVQHIQAMGDLAKQNMMLNQKASQGEGGFDVSELKARIME